MLANFPEKDKAGRYGKENPTRLSRAGLRLKRIRPKSNYLALISMGRSCSAELSAIAAQLEPVAEIHESRL